MLGLRVIVGISCAVSWELMATQGCSPASSWILSLYNVMWLSRWGPGPETPSFCSVPEEHHVMNVRLLQCLYCCPSISDAPASAH